MNTCWPIPSPPLSNSRTDSSSEFSPGYKRVFERTDGTPLQLDPPLNALEAFLE